MSGDIPFNVGPSDQVVSQAELAAQKADVRYLTSARQVASRESFMEEVEEAFNPYEADQAKARKSLKERPPTVSKEAKQEQAKRVQKKQRDADSHAQARQEQNSELKADRLKELRNLVLSRGTSSPEELLDDVRSFFGDVSLADEAMDYLLDTTEGDVAQRVRDAKALLAEQQGQEVRAGRNMGPESRDFAETGIGSPTELRNYYRDIIGNPREGNKLFQEMHARWRFEELKTVTKFLFEALGADLRSKGPSIARGELYRLTTEARVLQSILGVYYFFKRRYRLVRKDFARRGVVLPDEWDFELMADHFIQLVEEKYPTSTRVLRLAEELKLEEELLGQILVYQQYRDAIREVAPRIYRSLQHRYDLLTAIVEALEELEDQVEEEEEEDDGDV